jgi:hypothetical protein
VCSSDLWFLVLFPLLSWGAIAAIGYALGHRGRLSDLLLAAATGAAPIVAVAHLAKAAAKVAAWGGFLPLALHDPRGVDTLRALAAGSVATPAMAVTLPVVGWVMLVLIAVMAWKAWRWARQMPAESTVAAGAGLAGAALVFSAILTVWCWPGG